jgi:hypothetical protein
MERLCRDSLKIVVSPVRVRVSPTDEFAAWVGIPWWVLVALMALAALAAVATGGSPAALLSSFAVCVLLPVALLRVHRRAHRGRVIETSGYDSTELRSRLTGGRGGPTNASVTIAGQAHS